MRKYLFLIFTAGALCAFTPVGAPAAPIGGRAIRDALELDSPIQQARVFCYNRRTGRFLHWGYCKRRVVYRVYCRNRWTKKFLHWGHC